MPEKRSLLINKAAGIVARFASKDTYRPILNGVLMTNTQLVATDSYRLATVDLPKTDGDFPVVDGREVPDALAKPIIIPSKDLTEALRNIPRQNSTAIKALPILNHVGVVPYGDKAALIATDLETDRIVTTRPLAGAFPNYEQIMPAEDAEYAVKIGLNPRFLWEAAKAADDFLGKSLAPLTLHVTGPRKPIIITADNGEQVLTQLIMPVVTDSIMAGPDALRDRNELAEAIKLFLDDRGTDGTKTTKAKAREDLARALEETMPLGYVTKK